jgi:multidrug efflux system outer membrane protein
MLQTFFCDLFFRQQNRTKFLHCMLIEYSKKTKGLNMHLRARLLTTSLLMPLLLSACGNLVHTEPPALDAGIDLEYEDVVGDVSAQAWWKAFSDETLDQMIDQAMDTNLTVQAAITRVAQAQSALVGTGFTGSISGDVSADALRSGTEGGSTSNTRTAGFSPAMVIDLFGGVKEAREQALAQLEGSKLDEGTARLSVVSGVVDTYLEARYLQDAIEITKSALEKRRETTRMTEQRLKLGAGTELAAAQARVTLEEAEKDLVDLETTYRNTVYALATLLAQPSDDVFTALDDEKGLPAAEGASDEVPADLIRNRPDVRSAEQDLLAAASAVGVAKSEMYPSLSLAGSISTTSGTSAWSFGPSLSLPVLNQPVLKANVRSAEAEMEEAYVSWKASVLSAVEEASSAANSYAGTLKAVETAEEIQKAQNEVVRLTEFAFEAGSNTMMDVLEARQDADDAELAVLSAKRDLAQAWSALQISAGRGWAIKSADAI